jgi:hypothetical protein
MQGLAEMKKEPRTRGAYRPRFLALFSVREKDCSPQRHRGQRRNPKFESQNKFKILSPRIRADKVDFDYSDSSFEFVSDFEFRIFFLGGLSGVKNNRQTSEVRKDFGSPPKVAVEG